MSQRLTSAPHPVPPRSVGTASSSASSCAAASVLAPAPAASFSAALMARSMTSPGLSMASLSLTSTVGFPSKRFRSETVASEAMMTASASFMTCRSTNSAPEAPWISISISWPISLALVSSASAAIALWAMPVGQAVTPTTFISCSSFASGDTSRRAPLFSGGRISGGDLGPHQVDDLLRARGLAQAFAEALVHEPARELLENLHVQVVLPLGRRDHEYEVGLFFAVGQRRARPPERDPGRPDP